MALYRNDWDENIKYRVREDKAYLWRTVRPGETVDLDIHVAEAKGLTPVSLYDAEHQVEASESQEDWSFKKELVALNGIGPKTAEDLLENYETRDELEKALKEGVEVHSRSDIVEILKQWLL